MEPITIGIAFAAAKAAVAGVKEAIALGHEIQDCYHDIASFFNAQGEIEAAVVQQNLTTQTIVEKDVDVSLENSRKANFDTRK